MQLIERSGGRSLALYAAFANGQLDEFVAAFEGRIRYELAVLGAVAPSLFLGATGRVRADSTSGPRPVCAAVRGSSTRSLRLRSPPPSRR